MWTRSAKAWRAWVRRSEARARAVDAMRVLAWLWGLGLLCGASASTVAQPADGTARSTPSFDCSAAQKTVEHWVCASPELMQADQRLNEVYRNALAKPDGDAALAAQRASQLRWWRQRNRCDTPDCVVAAYAQRTAELQASNRRVLVLDGKRIAPVFSRTLPNVNDTRVVSGLALRRAVPTAFQLELLIDPADARP